MMASILLQLAGIDPQSLRNELDSLPWRPPAGHVVTTPTAVTASPEDPAKPVAPVVGKLPQTTPPAAARLDSHGFWQLQLAALANPDVARREQARIEKLLGPGTIALVADGGLTKLRWGNFPSREAADAARADLKTNHLEGFPVKSEP